MTATLTASERQHFAIARSRERTRAERGELMARIDQAVEAVGWERARPIVVATLGPDVPVTGPRGRWRGLLRKRTGARLMAALAVLPVQERLPLTPCLSYPRPTVEPSEGCPP